MLTSKICKISTFKLCDQHLFLTTHSNHSVCFVLFLCLEALYDCASLYSRNYKISGEYKLPADDYLGTPELDVSKIQIAKHNPMETTPNCEHTN